MSDSLGYAHCLPALPCGAEPRPVAAHAERRGLTMCSASNRCRCGTFAPAGHSRESARMTASRPARAASAAALRKWACTAGKLPRESGLFIGTPSVTPFPLPQLRRLLAMMGRETGFLSVRSMPAEIDMAAFNTEYKNMKAVRGHARPHAMLICVRESRPGPDMRRNQHVAPVSPLLLPGRMGCDRASEPGDQGDSEAGFARRREELCHIPSQRQGGGHWKFRRELAVSGSLHEAHGPSVSAIPCCGGWGCDTIFFPPRRHRLFSSGPRWSRRRCCSFSSRFRSR